MYGLCTDYVYGLCMDYVQIMYRLCTHAYELRTTEQIAHSLFFNDFKLYPIRVLTLTVPLNLNLNLTLTLTH